MTNKPSVHDLIFVLEPKNGKQVQLTPEKFDALGVKEREHLENWIVSHPNLLGTNLLVITKEYDKFDKSDKRVDILALAEDKKLVVIELKRSIEHSLADLQAIRYAAFCSTMSFDEMVALRAKHAKLPVEKARLEICDFVNDPNFNKLDTTPRIILAAGTFNNQELTSCVLWLRNNFNVDIRCVEITPYRLDDGRLVLVPRVLIPLPEAEQYIIKTEAKAAKQVPSAAQTEYRERNASILRFFRQLMPERAPAEPWVGPYMQVGTRYSGVHFEWYQRGQANAKTLDVAIHFENSSAVQNRALCDFLKEYKEVFAEHFDQEVLFDREWGDHYSSTFIRKPCLPWTDEIAEWAAKNMEKLITTVEPLLQVYFAKQGQTKSS
jgi:hypothetical protein